MGGVKLPNVKQIGPYLYFRRQVNGKDTYVRLPALTDPAFQRRYDELAGDHSREGPAHGTMADLVAQWRASPEARKGSDATKRNREYALAYIIETMGKRPYATLDTPNVYRQRDKLADTPGKADAVMSMLRSLMSFAVKRGLVASNPAAKVERLSAGEHAPWPEHVQRKALAEAGAMTRLAIVTVRSSAQRIGDCIRMRESWIADGMMTLTQQKTGKVVHIPVTEEWRAEIDRLPRKAMTILYDRAGRPFKETERLQRTVRALMNKIGHPGYTLHGLIKNRMNELAEQGATAHQLAAISGRSLAVCEHYTRAANARKLAESASSATIIPLPPVKAGKKAGK